MLSILLVFLSLWRVVESEILDCNGRREVDLEKLDNHTLFLSGTLKSNQKCSWLVLIPDMQFFRLNLSVEGIGDDEIFEVTGSDTIRAAHSINKTYTLGGRTAVISFSTDAMSNLTVKEITVSYGKISLDDQTFTSHTVEPEEEGLVLSLPSITNGIQKIETSNNGSVILAAICPPDNNSQEQFMNFLIYEDSLFRGSLHETLSKPYVSQGSNVLIFCAGSEGLTSTGLLLVNHYHNFANYSSIQFSWSYTVLPTGKYPAETTKTLDARENPAILVVGQAEGDLFGPTYLTDANLIWDGDTLFFQNPSLTIQAGVNPSLENTYLTSFNGNDSSKSLYQSLPGLFKNFILVGGRAMVKLNQPELGMNISLHEGLEGFVMTPNYPFPNVTVNYTGDVELEGDGSIYSLKLTEAVGDPNCNVSINAEKQPVVIGSNFLSIDGCSFRLSLTCPLESSGLLVRYRVTESLESTTGRSTSVISVTPTSTSSVNTLFSTSTVPSTVSPESTGPWTAAPKSTVSSSATISTTPTTEVSSSISTMFLNSTAPSTTSPKSTEPSTAPSSESTLSSSATNNITSGTESTEASSSVSTLSSISTVPSTTSPKSTASSTASSPHSIVSVSTVSPPTVSSTSSMKTTSGSSSRPPTSSTGKPVQVDDCSHPDVILNATTTYNSSFRARANCTYRFTVPVGYAAELDIYVDNIVKNETVILRSLERGDKYSFQEGDLKFNSIFPAGTITMATVVNSDTANIINLDIRLYELFMGATNPARRYNISNGEPALILSTTDSLQPNEIYVIRSISKVHISAGLDPWNNLGDVSRLLVFEGDHGATTVFWPLLKFVENSGAYISLNTTVTVYSIPNRGGYLGASKLIFNDYENVRGYEMTIDSSESPPETVILDATNGPVARVFILSDTSASPVRIHLNKIIFGSTSNQTLSIHATPPISKDTYRVASYTPSSNMSILLPQNIHTPIKTFALDRGYATLSLRYSYSFQRGWSEQSQLDRQTAVVSRYYMSPTGRLDTEDFMIFNESPFFSYLQYSVKLVQADPECVINYGLDTPSGLSQIRVNTSHIDQVFPSSKSLEIHFISGSALLTVNILKSGDSTENDYCSKTQYFLDPATPFSRKFILRSSCTITYIVPTYYTAYIALHVSNFGVSETFNIHNEKSFSLSASNGVLDYDAAFPGDKIILQAEIAFKTNNTIELAISLSPKPTSTTPGTGGESGETTTPSPATESTALMAGILFLVSALL